MSVSASVFVLGVGFAAAWAAADVRGWDDPRHPLAIWLELGFLAVFALAAACLGIFD